MSTMIIYAEDGGKYDFSSAAGLGNNFATVGELNQTRLWSEQEIPVRPGNVGIGNYAVSDGVSDAEGNLAKRIGVIHSYGDPMDASRGITIIFDIVNQIWPKSITVAVYADRDQQQQLAKKVYQPDGPYLYCPELATDTGVLAISIEAATTNMPHVRLRIASVYYGKQEIWGADKIISATITESHDPLSLVLPANVCELVVMPGRKLVFDADRKQRVEVYHNGNLQGVFFVNALSRIVGEEYQLSCTDYVGQLIRNPFVGNIYNGKNAGELIAEIMRSADVPYQIDPGIAEKTVSGVIGRMNCRDALAQVLFVVKAIFITSRNSRAQILPSPDAVTPIKAGLTGTGDRIDDIQPPRGLLLTAYAIKEREDGQRKGYSSETYGKDRKGIIVPFETAQYKDTPVGPVFFEAFSAFGAIVDGTKYHTYQGPNGQFQSTDWRFTTCEYIIDRVPCAAAGSVIDADTMQITGYGLVTTQNSQELADRCFTFFGRKKLLHASIIGDYRAGDTIEVEASDGVISGIITEARFRLTAGELKIEEVTMRC